MALQKIRLTPKVNANITIEGNGLGLVPEIEEREAAVFVLCPWKEWDNLSWQDRAAAVAHFRVHLLIDMHVTDAAEKQAKADSGGSDQIIPNSYARR